MYLDDTPQGVENWLTSCEFLTNSLPYFTSKTKVVLSSLRAQERHSGECRVSKECIPCYKIGGLLDGVD